MADLLWVGALAALVWFWFDSMRARERALQSARAACRRHEVQLLDETVALASLRPARNGEGRVAFRRIYRFEFSDAEGVRRAGGVTLLGLRPESCHLELGPFTLHESGR